ncbi:uncharacterized protein LOC133844521 [Drosophila sulfurigaster albostrigata]|uniref:uncharacterized protein LOC133844521 n=1 Tax=Drosophila sulfurigaster albostrigata TaxID=89887 RepID=UPI002D21ABA8|nr:uncharacterized protein LOC133844521 [Drosophila sulfurigaster albostrigata]
MKFLLVFVVVASVLYNGVGCRALRVDEETKFLVLEDDNMDRTVLDCNYDLNDTDVFLTVKWFRNDRTIYQWIRGSQPAPIPDFKNDVDSTYESSKDPNKQYSSLALINPTISSTGDYKCVVQTRSETITIHKSLQVIDVRNRTLNLSRYKIHNETQLECTVLNVFPKPTLTIISDDDDIIKVVNHGPYEQGDGYYNATTLAVVQDNDDDADAYKCVVNFEGYSQNFTTVITSGSGPRYVDYRIVLLNIFVLSLLANLNIFN